MKKRTARRLMFLRYQRRLFRRRHDAVTGLTQVPWAVFRHADMLSQRREARARARQRRTTPEQTCARCGHTTPACARCGRRWPTLGGRIGDRRYCHTYVTGVPSTQTCYALSAQDTAAITNPSPAPTPI